MIFLTNMDQSEKVITYWFEGSLNVNYKSKWFPTGSDEIQHRADVEISSNFKDLLNAAMNNELEGWKVVNIKSHLALIIILDQFSRHIFRLENYPINHSSRVLADSMAVMLSEEIMTITEWKTKLTTSEFVFSLMPFRHSPTIDRLTFILSLIDERKLIETEYHSIEFLQKFRKQTLRRLQTLQDRAKALAAESILEKEEFQTDEKDIFTNKLVISIEKFLKENMISMKSNYDEEKKTGESVAVSLSGGVDSMIILKILVVLKHHQKLPIQDIVAIHIDYANRLESNQEADYLEYYCKKYNIIFIKRIISEVSRESAMSGATSVNRSDYEQISRDIRYNLYKEVCNNYHIAGVFLGHHLGDIQENVLSNVMRGVSVLSLGGMVANGITNGAVVWRPLLDHPKTDIFAFAHKYGVPYFRDTTPSWSTRGKLRNQLVPLLIEMYGPGCLPNLATLAGDSQHTRQMLHHAIYEPFLKTVQRYQGGLVVQLNAYRKEPYGLYFWKEMLKELMHSMGMSLVRESAVSCFMKRLQGGDHVLSGSDELPPIVCGWIELRKGFQSYITPAGELVIFKDGLISSVDGNNKGKGKSKKKQSNMVITSVDSMPQQLQEDSYCWPANIRIGIDDLMINASASAAVSVRLGSWSLRIRRGEVGEGANEAEVIPQQRILLNPKDLLNGMFSYNISYDWCQGDGVELGVYSDCRDPEAVSTMAEVYPVFAIGGMDLRLRCGLPLLVPIVTTGDHNGAETHRITLALQYSCCL